ncbi:MAG TPA: FAD-linked oxidase C-terminal domain-containing protein [Acidimicrobiales bacterium]|jgi:glycolate oxidase|nr:FAD-linked oxidase C-terminal domain-containing protein [Acidimicrobiales bacterium]
MTQLADLLADLAAALDAKRVHADPLELTLYARDASVIEGQAGVVVFPTTTEEVQAVVRVARAHGRPITPRGSGTGLSGGAVPLDDAVVVVTTRMDRILEVDEEDRVAWVQPGVLNLDLSRAVAHLGLHFAPDPSSQQSCSVGGNVANNSGGPHCLAYGVTSAHVLAVEVVLPDGSLTLLGGLDADPAGYDLRGAFVGSEGTMGIATRIAVRLTPIPPDVRTLLADFPTVEGAAAAVTGIIAAGIVPAALEMMDAEITRAVEAYVHAGFPTDAAAVLLVEVDGMTGGVDAAAAAVQEVCGANGARHVRIAQDMAERALLWKGRKSAFGAIARIAPNYYLHDAVVPRTKLVEVLNQVYEIAARHQLVMMNVFHAGDGNLHPLIVFDRRVEGVMERVHHAGAEIMEVCVAAGGVLSGEHGIGLEKRDFMGLIFSPDDLDAQARLRDAFDPEGMCNPRKVLPAGSRCGDLQQVPEGAWI